MRVPRVRNHRRIFDIIYIMRNIELVVILALAACAALRMESAPFTTQQRQKQCATEALSAVQLPRKAVKAGTFFVLEAAVTSVLSALISPQPTRYLYSNGADNHPRVATAALKKRPCPQRDLRHLASCPKRSGGGTMAPA